MKPAVNEPDVLSPQFLIGDSEIDGIKTRISEYGVWFTQLSTALGMSDIEANKILGEVYSKVNNDFENYPEARALKIWFSKIVVRKIVFKISTDLFNGQGNSGAHAVESGKNSYRNMTYATRNKQMPLSLKVVYLLRNMGFSETEVSDILNVSPIKVRERLNKALAIVANR